MKIAAIIVVAVSSGVAAWCLWGIVHAVMTGHIWRDTDNHDPDLKMDQHRGSRWDI